MFLTINLFFHSINVSKMAFNELQMCILQANTFRESVDVPDTLCTTHVGEDS